FLAGAHHVGHPQQQAPPQAAAGVRAGEILGGEAARLEQGGGQGIAHGQRRGGGGGGGEVQRAGLGGHADIQVHGGGARQRRGGVAGEGDHLHRQPRHLRQQRQHLGTVAGVRDRQQHVAAHHH